MSESRDRESRVEKLSPARRRLFDQLQQQLRDPSDAISRRPAAVDRPLSLSQEALWFIERLSPGTAAFNVPAATHVVGPLDVDALQGALDDLVARHEVLRTRFASRDGRPYAVLDEEPLTIERAAVDRDQSLARAIEQRARRPFDLATDRLLRVSLLETGDNEAVLVIVAHHSVCDGHSIKLFLDELRQAYAHHAGRGPGQEASRDGKRRLQYGDYAYWERQRLSGPEFARELEHWKGVLAYGCPELELPVRTDGQGSLSSRASNTVRFEVSEETVTGLKALASRHSGTLFMALLALWKLTFHAWSGQTVIVVGMPAANRLRRELRDLLGMFTTTIVIRTELAETESFDELFATVRDRVVDALEHQEMPFSKLVEALRPERSGQQPPLVRATAWLKTRGAYELSLPGVETTPLEVDTGIATYDFSVVMCEQNGGVNGTITFPKELFDEAVVEAMAQTFGWLAREVVSSSSRSLEALARQARRAKTTSTTEVLELTENQLLVWAGEQLHRGSTVYNESARWLVRGAIDQACFDLAWRSLVAHSDVLGARIRVVSGTPRMEFTADAAPALQYVDLSDRDDPEREWNGLTRSLLNGPVDLEQSTCSCWLARLGEQLYGVYLGIHQIATDGWTFQRLYDRLGTAYRVALSGSSERDEPQYPQFLELVEKERRYPKSAEGAAARAYWEAKLARSVDVPSLYGSSVERASMDIVRERVHLTEPQEQAFRALAARAEFASFSDDLTLMALSLTLLGAYVTRVSDSESFFVGVPFHNRSRPSVLETAGLLMTVCPVYVDGSGRPTFRALFDRILGEIRGCLPHTRFVNSNSQARPIYTVMLDYQSHDYARFAGIDSQVELLSSDQQLEALKLDVQRNTITGRLELWLGMDQTVLEAAGHDEVMAHWRSLFDALVCDPEQVVSSVPMLTPNEERTVAVAGTGAAAATSFVSVVDRVQESVARNPDSVAVLAGARHLTYSDLWRRSGDIASSLCSLGNGTESVVGLSLTDGIDRIVAILGVLRSGCCYLALHPSNPQARDREMLRDAKAVLLLVDPDTSTSPDVTDCPILTLADLPSGSLPSAEIRAPLHPEQVAYVLFTSGSSGYPKGVMVTHRGLASFVSNACDYLALGPHDRMLQFADISFDTSLEELLPTLVAGATLVARPQKLLDSPRSFWTALGQQAITAVDLPSSVWHFLASDLESSEARVPQSLHTIVIGGEQAHSQAWRQWSEASRRTSRTRPLRILNTYGPTETTVAVSAFESTSDEPLDRNDVVPIGRALPGVAMSATTPSLVSTPPSVPGELLVSGATVARGYCRRPGETADRFVPDPYPTSPGARSYRTGDRAFVNRHREWVYAGRSDRQVKHNGYRIELDEIEAHLTRVPGVSAAAVYLSDRAGVTACYVCADTSTTAADIRHSLAQALPAYMIPSTLVREDSLPLDSRGKVDYRQLRFQTRPTGERIAARTDLEVRIAKAWAELLSLPLVECGVTDSFFHLGGHSLLGAQLMARLEKELGVELPLRVLFDTPTIEGLANTVARLTGEDELDSLAHALEELSPTEVEELLGSLR